MSHDTRVFWRTILAVFATGLLCFIGAAIYDSFNGGPEARQASIDARAVLAGFQAQQERSECVTSYTVADSASDALLTAAIGELIGSASVEESGEISPGSIDLVVQRTNERITYLTLRLQTNEFCDPDQEGGPRPLSQEDLPQINSEG